MTPPPTSSTLPSSITFDEQEVPIVDREKKRSSLWIICHFIWFFALLLAIQNLRQRKKCTVCPHRHYHLSQPDRVVPGESGLTCAEVISSQLNCESHKSLMEKFDLASYCGCDGSTAPQSQCIFFCPSSSPAQSENSSNPTTMSPTLTESPTVSPIEISATNNPSTFLGAVSTDQVGLSSWAAEDANMCRDLSTIMPFIIEPGYCEEINTMCCTSTITATLEIEREIPEACKMCGDGFTLLSDKLRPGNAVEQTCGEVAKFYEHAAEESFCIQIMPLLREDCCLEDVAPEIAPEIEPEIAPEIEPEIAPEMELNATVTAQHEIEPESSAMISYSEWKSFATLFVALCIDFHL